MQFFDIPWVCPDHIKFQYFQINEKALSFKYDESSQLKFTKKKRNSAYDLGLVPHSYRIPGDVRVFSDII